MRLISALLAVALLVSLTDLVAQEIPSIKPGDQVRIQTTRRCGAG